MEPFFFQLYDILNTKDHYMIVMAVYGGLAVLASALRIISCTSYRTALLVFRINAKELKNKEEIKKIRSGLLRKVIADYIRIADKNVTRIPTRSVVERHVLSKSFFGWRYVSIMQLVEALENGFILLGLILALVFSENAMVYGTLAVAGFVLTRVMGAFFDFKTAHQVLTDELILYVEREIGFYYAADAGSAVARLKIEMVEAVSRQSVMLKGAIEMLSAQLSDAIVKGLSEMNTGTEKIAEQLHKPIGDWHKALSDAGQLQTQMNTAGERLLQGSQNINSASDLLARHLQGHSQALTDQLNTLVTAIDTLKESNTLYSQNHEAFLKQAQYIERNQAVLETSMQSFEAALQNTTRHMGDGFGVFAQLHAQSTSQAMNETLQENLAAIVNTYQETLQRMTALFDQLREQNKDIAAHLHALHEKLALLEKKAM